MRQIFLTFFCLFSLSVFVLAQSHNHDHDGHDHDHSHDTHQAADAHGNEDGHAVADCGHVGHHGEFDPSKTAFHHISDQNIYSIGPFHFPLPCFLYAPSHGWGYVLFWHIQSR